MTGGLLELMKVFRTRRLPPEELETLRDQKLRAVVRHAYESVPYYRSLFDSAGLSPGDIRGVEDLKYIPVTTKEDLRSAGLGNIMAGGVNPAACITIPTSGTTGKPFVVYLTRRDLRARRQVEFRTLVSAGFRPKGRLAVLGPPRPHRTTLSQRLGFYRSVNISPLLPPERQIKLLKGMRPTFLWASPTDLRVLMKRLDYRLRDIVRPRVLITSAEVFDEITRERVRADLNPEMFNFYGSYEVGRIAAECPAHEGLHVNADHVVLECLDGERSAGPGRAGTTVITTLNVLAMPFIRYRMGDICTFLEKACSCGCAFPLIGPPKGREEELLSLPSGKLLSVGGLEFVLRDFFEIIDQFRFIQESRDHLLLQLVLRVKEDKQTLEKMRRALVRYLGEPVRMDIRIVNHIKEEKKKFRTFISKLPRADL
jgi:phenylacetate-CoA ligase